MPAWIPGAFILANPASSGIPGTNYGVRLTDNGGVADAVKLTDGAISVAGNVLTSASAAFTLSDVGKAIAVEAAGVGNTGFCKVTSGSATVTQTMITVKITATGGTFALTFNAQTTAAQAFNVPAATLQSQLEGLSSIGVGHVTVSLSGTTYTIVLLSGASSVDTTLWSVDGSLLTASINGAPAAATLTYQLFNYSDVGRRIQIPGAGVAGGVLSAFIGSIEPTTTNVAYMVDATGAAFNASTSVTSGAYYNLNWMRTTIAGFTNANTVTLTATCDAGVQLALTGLEVHYGTDNAAALATAIASARAATPPILDLGVGTYLTSAGVSTTAATGITIFGSGPNATEIRGISVDSEGESCRLLIAGITDTATGRATGVNLRNFTWSVPTAHTRGAGNLAGYPNNKTGAAGLLLSKVNYFSIHNVILNNNYGVAYNLQNCSHGLISHCKALNSWADSFNSNNANGSGPITSPGSNDITFIGCEAYNSGDDMFTTNYYVSSGPRSQRVSFIGCRGYQSRQGALGRGVSIVGGDNITVSGVDIVGTNGCGFDVGSSAPANAINTSTITTPSTGAVVTFLAAPANMTAGLTQMRLFNGSSGQTWLGDVASIGGAGTIITLTASTGYATTCPFTGTYLVQWGDNTNGFRWGTGGSKHVNISGCSSDISNLNPAADGTLFAAFRCGGGQASTEAVSDVMVTGLTLSNCYESGIIVNNLFVTNKSDVATADFMTTDIHINGVTITTTGLSTLTSSRPWAGVYLRLGRNITLQNAKIRDTADEAVILAASGLGGQIKLLDIEASDIGRIPQAGPPLAAAFNLSTSTLFNAQVERIFLTNPSGTSGGTKYVCTAVLSELPSGSTCRGVSSDIAGQTLLTEAAARYRVVISPVMYRGKGTPEGVVTAPVGAMYERSDGGVGTVLYMKESGTGNTGWIAYAAPGGSPGPELDMVYNSDPLQTYSAAVWGLANRVYVMRLRGNGSISNINFQVKVQSGNVMAALYANTGSGRNARPTGAPLQASVLTATAVAGNQAIPLAGAQTITHLNFWAAILADNVTISTDRVSATSGDGSGYAHSYDSASSAMETIGVHTLNASGSYVPFLFGS